MGTKENGNENKRIECRRELMRSRRKKREGEGKEKEAREVSMCGGGEFWEGQRRRGAARRVVGKEKKGDQRGAQREMAWSKHAVASQRYPGALPAPL